jgi:hypothetical protein
MRNECLSKKLKFQYLHMCWHIVRRNLQPGKNVSDHINLKNENYKIYYNYIGQNTVKIIHICFPMITVVLSHELIKRLG